MGLTCHVGRHLSRSMLCRLSSFCCAFAYATGQLILFSESENIVFQVRKHYFLSQKTLFPAYARNRVRAYINKVSAIVIPWFASRNRKTFVFLKKSCENIWWVAEFAVPLHPLSRKTSVWTAEANKELLDQWGKSKLAWSSESREKSRPKGIKEFFERLTSTEKGSTRSKFDCTLSQKQSVPCLRHGGRQKDIFTMKSLILAQDER